MVLSCKLNTQMMHNATKVNAKDAREYRQYTCKPQTLDCAANWLRLHVPTFRCLAVTYAGGSLHMCVCVFSTRFAQLL
jgi:hypothetical protein